MNIDDIIRMVHEQSQDIKEITKMLTEIDIETDKFIENLAKKRGSLSGTEIQIAISMVTLKLLGSITAQSPYVIGDLIFFHDTILKIILSINTLIGTCEKYGKYAIDEDKDQENKPNFFS